MISRRTFIKALITAAVYYPFKGVYAYQNSDRILKMYNIHTDERLHVAYSSSGVYDPDAIDRINYFLRCHYTNEVLPIDIKVIDLLCDIKDRCGRHKEITIISGYRSTLYNSFLRRHGRHVSKNSMHLEGRAIDFSIEGVNNRKLVRIAKSFQAGGVGRYPEFIHIDTGKVRYW
jgi:uncharacterized protein YcbK (DUF882 family)